jgi:hypothetical protein
MFVRVKTCFVSERGSESLKGSQLNLKPGGICLIFILSHDNVQGLTSKKLIIELGLRLLGMSDISMRGRCSVIRIHKT